MGKFVNQENCNAILAALTTFRRMSIRFEKGEASKNEKFQSITSLLLKNGVSHNYNPFIREALVERRLLSADYKKWNKEKAEPNIDMATSIAEAASKKLCEYQQARKLARQSAPIENTSKTPKTTIVDVHNAIMELQKLASQVDGIELNITINYK